MNGGQALIRKELSLEMGRRNSENMPDEIKIFKDDYLEILGTIKICTNQ